MAQSTTLLSLGTERIPKLLLKYALPAIIAMTATSLYNMVDSIFIGRGVNALALSGLGITLPMMNLSAAFGSLVGLGAAAQISIKMGQNDHRSADLILGNLVVLNTIIGLTYTVVGLVFLDPILYFFGASAHTIGYARSYMQILLIGNVITHLYLGMNDILRASGYPGKAMAIMLAAVALNCVLNAVLIFGFGWGIAGAAWATVAAQLTALILEIIHFRNPKHVIYFKRKAIGLSRTIVRSIISIGLAPFLMNICSSLIVILINRTLIDHGGDLYIGSYSVVNRVAMLFVMIVMGLNMGMQPIVGYNFGAEKYDRVGKTLKYTIGMAVGTTTLGFILCQLFPGAIIGLFTADTEMIDIAGHALRLILTAFPLVGFQMVTSNFFQSIGIARKAIFLSLTRQLLFVIPFILILPNYFGSDGVWMSMPLADVAATVLAAILLYLQFRKFRQRETTTL